MTEIQLRSLPAIPITPENFAPFGQVITASEDGTSYSAEDAQLSLDRGIPRFYIMRLHHRGLSFTTITRHMQCTQCLGSLEGQPWMLGVAPPSSGSQPDLNSIQAFRIPGNCFIKLNLGTWHAGPYFIAESVDFYNLELSDTNVVDHDTTDLKAAFGLEFAIE
ncbi:MAG: ureidoglycolate lyase [Cyanobacteria bacterium P01_A01_bin.3]